MLFYHYLFYFFGLLLFVVDIFCYSFFEKQIFYFLLCFFILYIYDEEEKQTEKILFILLLISLESSLNYGQFGTQLLYILPISLIAYHAQKLFYAVHWQPSVTLISCICAQTLLIEPFLLMNPASFSYTNSKIIANMITLWCMSLIVSSQGKLGNRLNAISAFERKVRTPNE